MKKTEKVEIRVSPADKAALTQMSHESGRSVSETVRGLLLTQAGTAPGDKRRPSMTILQKATYASGGAALGAVIASGLLLSLSAAHPKPTSYFLNVTLLDGPHDQRREYQASTAISIDQKASTQIRLPGNAAEAYRMDIDLKRQPDGSVFAVFALCRETTETCTGIAKPSLLVARDESATLQISDDQNRRLFIGMHAADKTS